MNYYSNIQIKKATELIVRLLSLKNTNSPKVNTPLVPFEIVYEKNKESNSIQYKALIDAYTSILIRAKDLLKSKK